MSKPYIIACTGGIGSGKSYVAKAFAAIGVPVYDCDSRAKELYDNDASLVAAVMAAAGEDVVCNGRIERKKLASRIFSDPAVKSAVEAAVHPAVQRDFLSWAKSCCKDVVLIESAIFLEVPLLSKLADFVLLVTAPMDIRIKRVMARDNVDRQSAQLRIESQWSDSRRAEKADYIIETNDRDAIIPQILNILNKFLRNEN